MGTHNDLLISYKDLSRSLKAAIIMAWILGGLAIIQFSVGFIIGMLEYSL